MLGPGWMQLDSSGPVQPLASSTPPLSQPWLAFLAPLPFFLPQTSISVAFPVSSPLQQNWGSTFLSGFTRCCIFLQTLAYAILFQLPGKILRQSGYSLPYWSSVQLFPLGRSIPGSVSNVTISSPKMLTVSLHSPSLTNMETALSLPVCLSS